MINVQKINASSHMFGFRNYLSPPTIIATIPAQTLAAGGYAVVSSTTTLNNANAVSSVKIQYATIETDWRQAQGRTNAQDVTLSYQLQSMSYYSGGNFVVDTYVSDITGAPNPIPAQTINISIRLFKSPFAL